MFASDKFQMPRDANTYGVSLRPRGNILLGILFEYSPPAFLLRNCCFMNNHVNRNESCCRLKPGYSKADRLVSQSHTGHSQWEAMQMWKQAEMLIRDAQGMQIGATQDLGKREQSLQGAGSCCGNLISSEGSREGGKAWTGQKVMGEGLAQSAEDPRLWPIRFWTIRGREQWGFVGGCNMLNCRVGLNRIF